jgi:predicted Zn-dependent protease
MENKNYKFLSKKQIQSLNLNYTNEETYTIFQEHELDNESLNIIQNPSFLKLFKKVNKKNIFETEKNHSILKYKQSYDKKLKTDQRYQDKTNRKIIIANLYHTKDKKLIKQYNETVLKIKMLMQVYFNLEVEICTDQNSIYNLSFGQNILKKKKKSKKSEKETFIFDKSQNLQFPLIYDKNSDSYDVIRLLDIFVEYVENNFTLLILTDLNIYEETNSNEIYGLAYGGNGVAVISLKGDNEREIIITAVHETLHTLNYDHCTLWDCIMNAKNDEENSQINLCPLDLMKLKIFNDKISFKERFESMKKIFEDFKWENDIKNIEKILNYFNN